MLFSSSRGRRVLPVAATYVRAGRFADLTGAEINAEEKVKPELLLIKNDSVEDNRRVAVFRFPLEGIDPGKERLTLAPGFVVVPGGITSGFSVYQMEDDVDVEALTWNKLPDEWKKLPCEGFMSLDVTDAVAEAKRAGRESIVLILEPVEKTGPFYRLPNPVMTGRGTALCAAPRRALVYERALSGDRKLDKAIWREASRLVDEWDVEAKELLARPDEEASLIESPEEQYSKVVQYSKQSTTFDTARKESPTRTVGALGQLPEGDYPVDIYGGLVDESRRREATGFFRTEMVGDRHWLFDPLGYPFVLRGLSALTYSYQGSDNQAEAMRQTYGCAEVWADKTTRHLMDDIGFVAGTAIAPELRNVENRIAEQQTITFMSQYGREKHVNASVGGSTVFSENNTMPVFDPDFVTFSEKRAEMALNYKDDPYLIGFTTDNELPMQQSMLLGYLTIDPYLSANYYSYAVAWTFLVRRTGKKNPNEKDITPELLEEFRGFVWARYFKVVCAAMRRVDDKHMLMGTRFLHPVKNADWVLRVAGKYLDCMTINWYMCWEPDAADMLNIQRKSHLPFVVTEFYAKAGDSEGHLGNTAGAGWYVQTQEDRGAFYQNFTLRMLECKAAVGWYWFQYIDNDPDANGKDSSNKGIFSSFQNMYQDLADAMIELNKNVYGLIAYFDAK